jgi:Flp pilus assembly protein TadD
VDVVRRDDRLIAQLALSLPNANDPEPRPVVEITPEGGSAPLLRQELRVGRLDNARRWLAQESVSMNLLPPGRYTITATVTPGAPPLSRTFDVAAGTVPTPASIAPGMPTANGATPAPAAARLALIALAKPEAFDTASVLDPGRVGPVLAQLAQRINGSAREALNGAGAGPWPTDSSSGPLASAPVAAHFVAGLGLLQAGQLEAAAREFRTALRIAPDFAPTMAYLAACYAAGGKDMEAAAAWQTTSVREREAAWLQQLAIEAWLRAERPAAALALARRARERFPTDPSFARLQARAELADGRVREGLDTLASLDDGEPSLLLMGLAALYTAAQDGTPVWDAARDRAAMKRWRDAYAAGGGESLALVDSWLADSSAP